MGPYIEQHYDDFLRLLNNIDFAKPKFDNTKNHNIFYNERPKITNSLTNSHKVKKWKKSKIKNQSL